MATPTLVPVPAFAPASASASADIPSPLPALPILASTLLPPKYHNSRKRNHCSAPASWATEHASVSRKLPTRIKDLDEEVLEGGMEYGRGGVVGVSFAGGGGIAGVEGEAVIYSTIASHLLSSTTTTPSATNLIHVTDNLNIATSTTATDANNITTAIGHVYYIDTLGTFSPRRLHSLIIQRLRARRVKEKYSSANLGDGRIGGTGFTHHGGYVYERANATTSLAEPIVTTTENAGEASNSTKTRIATTSSSKGDHNPQEEALQQKQKSVEEEAADLLSRVKIMRVFDFEGVMEAVAEVSDALFRGVVGDEEIRRGGAPSTAVSQLRMVTGSVDHILESGETEEQIQVPGEMKHVADGDKEDGIRVWEDSRIRSNNENQVPDEQREGKHVLTNNGTKRKIIIADSQAEDEEDEGEDEDEEMLDISGVVDEDADAAVDSAVNAEVDLEALPDHEHSVANNTNIHNNTSSFGSNKSAEPQLSLQHPQSTTDTDTFGSAGATTTTRITNTPPSAPVPKQAPQPPPSTTQQRPAQKSTSPPSLIILSTLPRVLTPLMHQNHIRGHALLVHLLRTLTALTLRYQLCCVIVNGVVGGASASTSTFDKDKDGDGDNGVAGGGAGAVRGSLVGGGGGAGGRNGFTVVPDGPSIFASNGAVRPALGRTFPLLLDLSLLVSDAGGVGGNGLGNAGDAGRSEGSIGVAGRSEESRAYNDAGRRIWKGGEGRGRVVVEVLEDRYGGRVGRWCVLGGDGGM